MGTKTSRFLPQSCGLMEASLRASAGPRIDDDDTARRTPDRHVILVVTRISEVLPAESLDESSGFDLSYEVSRAIGAYDFIEPAKMIGDGARRSGVGTGCQDERLTGGLPTSQIIEQVFVVGQMHRVERRQFCNLLLQRGTPTAQQPWQEQEQPPIGGDIEQPLKQEIRAQQRPL